MLSLTAWLPSQCDFEARMEKTLKDVFEILNQWQIRYCLLRGLTELSEHVQKKEVDILVLPEHIADFARAIDKLGFVRVPSWGHAPHHFFIAFDKENDTWLKLDVVTELRYGRPIRYIQVDLVERCIETRLQRDGIYILSPEYECITLLLHCILDKRYFSDEHRQRLLTIIESGSTEIQRIMETLFKQYVPPIFSWGAVIQAIDRADWQWFLDQRNTFSKTIFWMHPLLNIRLYLENRLVRLIRPFLFAFRQRGLSIALLAPDGAGKSTLAKTLARDDILRARMIYMGSNIEASTVGLPTTAWLKKRLKSVDSREKKVWYYLLKMTNYGNRVLEQWLRCVIGLYHKCAGRFVIFDRYAYDSLLAPPAKTLGKMIQRRLLLRSCISPDLVFLLDAPGQVLFERKGEHSPTRLEKQRQIFLGLKDKISNMIIVDATRPADDVRRDILAIIWERYGAHVA